MFLIWTFQLLPLCFEKYLERAPPREGATETGKISREREDDQGEGISDRDSQVGAGRKTRKGRG